MLKLVLFIFICLLAGLFGSIATGTSVDTWYAGLTKPALTPPDVVFGPVWTILYVLMGIAGWRIWKIDGPSKHLLRRLFVLQLVLNVAWSFLFFAAQDAQAGLIDILVLWACLFGLIRVAWKNDRLAALLLMPYILWVTFAAYLNAGIWWLNR